MRLTFKLFLLGFLLTGCITSQSMPVSTPTTYKPIIATATALATLTVIPVSTIIPTATPTAEYPEIKVSLKGEGGTYFTYLEGFVDHVNSLAWSGDGKTLIIASQQNYLVYYDTQSQKATIHPVNLWVTSVTVSPDKKTLAAISAGIGDSASVRFINLETGETISTIKVEKPPIIVRGNTHIVYRGEGIFAPDGKTFILNSGKQITLWDFASGNQIKVLFTSDTNFLTSGLFFNPAKNLLFTRYSIVENTKEPKFLRWDTNTWKLTKTFTGDFFGFSFSPDGNTFTPIGGGVNIVHSDSATELFNFIGSKNLGLYSGELIAYHPSGKYAAIGNRGYTTIYTNKGQFWYLLSGFSAEVLEFSPDGKQLAAGGGSERPGLVAIWNNLNFP
ncbi:MAG: PD40 domain-containing protein [Chloroflexi bacterium]|nr:PD40 domain-containing protein [Chloroflexota bacterium]